MVQVEAPDEFAWKNYKKKIGNRRLDGRVVNLERLGDCLGDCDNPIGTEFNPIRLRPADKDGNGRKILFYTISGHA